MRSMNSTAVTALGDKRESAMVARRSFETCMVKDWDVKVRDEVSSL